MKKHITWLVLFSVMLFIIMFNSQCNNNTDVKEIKSSDSLYLNHGDTATYVGINTCKTCHYNIYESFIQTGMGQSFDKASKLKTAALFGPAMTVYDKFNDMYYHPYFSGDTMKLIEFRLEGKDTIYKRQETVNYIIGSGQHTNSHMMIRNGYLTQMPLTFYTQKKQWDLPPGFEDGYNSRFSRIIGLECMSCHNSYPEFVEGSENKYSAIPNGINCERCHGPGSIHVKQVSSGNIVDTSRFIDYTIVNPGKLDPELQFDVCQRCHLQGNAVLKENRSFYDFKPGQRLSDYITVFLPKYSNSDDQFIMASHADRLKQSQCYIKSKTQTKHNTLRPYKNTMTCVTCHNPHESVKFKKDEFFNNKCNNCHNTSQHNLCTASKNILAQAQNNCVSCHMPRSGSIDIPHVSMHDHYIRKPDTKESIAEKAKTFLGLYAINEKHPDNFTRANAYINQYEKFGKNPIMLDSAELYINRLRKLSLKQHLHIIEHLYFLKENFTQIIKDIDSFDQNELLNKMLINKSLENKDAWLCYRIGEAYNNSGRLKDALTFYKQATYLAPYYPDFLNKYYTALVNNNDINTAREQYQKMIVEFPDYAPAFSNLGYIYLLQNNVNIALVYINKALQLDPDYELALFNKVSILLYENKKQEAKQILKHILSKNPEQEKAQQLLYQLK